MCGYVCRCLRFGSRSAAVTHHAFFTRWLRLRSRLRSLPYTTYYLRLRLRSTGSFTLLHIYTRLLRGCSGCHTFTALHLRLRGSLHYAPVLPYVHIPFAFIRSVLPVLHTVGLPRLHTFLPLPTFTCLLCVPVQFHRVHTPRLFTCRGSGCALTGYHITTRTFDSRPVLTVTAAVRSRSAYVPVVTHTVCAHLPAAIAFLLPRVYTLYWLRLLRLLPSSPAYAHYRFRSGLPLPPLLVGSAVRCVLVTRCYLHCTATVRSAVAGWFVPTVIRFWITLRLRYWLRLLLPFYTYTFTQFHPHLARWLHILPVLPYLYWFVRYVCCAHALVYHRSVAYPALPVYPFAFLATVSSAGCLRILPLPVTCCPLPLLQFWLRFCGSHAAPVRFGWFVRYHTPFGSYGSLRRICLYHHRCRGSCLPVRLTVGLPGSVWLHTHARLRTHCVATIHYRRFATRHCVGITHAFCRGSTVCCYRTHVYTHVLLRTPVTTRLLRYLRLVYLRLVTFAFPVPAVAVVRLLPFHVGSRGSVLRLGYARSLRFHIPLPLRSARTFAGYGSVTV